MGFRHVTLRQRLFHAVQHEVDDTKHRHVHEYLHEFLLFFTNLMFLIGSVCFLEGVGFTFSVFMVGDWLFIVAAFVQLALATQTLHEQFVAKKHLSLKYDERDRHEVMETCFFFIACFIFWVGSVFFMPGIYKTKDAEFIGKEIGSWGFVIGSMGLVLATYFNALGLAAERAKHPEDTITNTSCTSCIVQPCAWHSLGAWHLLAGLSYTVLCSRTNAPSRVRKYLIQL